MRETRFLLTPFRHLVLFALSLLFFATASQAQESVDLRINFAKDTQARVLCDFHHSGSVIVNNEEQGETSTLPLDVNAKITFFQLTTGEDQTIRFFENAAGKIKLEKGITTPALADSNRLIVARLKSSPGELVEMASLAGVLEQAELELIQNPADPMTLPAVFNKTDVKQGDQWKPSNSALAKLLRVHEINESDVKLVLKKLDTKWARIYVMGTVLANVDDVSTEMELSGIAVIDHATNALSSFKLGIRENRSPGQIAPGFDGKTKLDIRISDDRTPELSPTALAKHTKNRKVRQRVQWQSETGNFVVNFEPRWKLIAAEQEAAILRFIDGDELLAQCNIVQLPSRPADNPLTLDAYKTEVAKIIKADKNAQLVGVASIATPPGHTALRVVVAGIEDGVDINWFYYHVSDKDGRQVTLVFTMAQSVAKRVSTIATQLVNEFVFRPNPKKVAEAGSDQADAKQNR